MTSLRLAMCGPPDALEKGLTAQTMPPAQEQNDQQLPALLVSNVYLDAFQKRRSRYSFRDWSLDSGAFSAWKSGTEIDLSAYIETCLHLLATDEKLTEVFALDVIGDHKATLKNTERMWDAGVPAIPAYHPGEPESYLLHIAKTYPKIAIGGIVPLRGNKKFKFCEQVFARVWPKAIHGFGVGTERMVLGLPFHSVDSTSWEIGPCGFGSWRSYGYLNVRGGSQNLRTEVEWHLKLERRAQKQWSKEMEQLNQGATTVRLAVNAQSNRADKNLAQGTNP